MKTLDRLMEALDARRDGRTLFAQYSRMGLTTSLFVQVRRGVRDLGIEALGAILIAYPELEREVLDYLRERGQEKKEKAG